MNQDVVILTLPTLTSEQKWAILKKEIFDRIEEIDSSDLGDDSKWLVEMFEVRAIVTGN